MEIQEIKARLSIKDVLAFYNLQANANKHINCPFHDDKTPSMRVYEETNTVYCFSGKCSTHGKSQDVIEFVMKKENCSKHEAILKCVAMINDDSPSPSTAIQENAFEIIWNVLKKSLLSSGRGTVYLRNRGLEPVNIGYHSGLLKSGKYAKEAELCGLVRDADGVSPTWAKECVIFALRDMGGAVVSFYGRSINSKNHYYQNGRCGLYPCYPSPNAKSIILTESIIDAATLLQIKVLENYEVLALFGTNGLTLEHKNALKSCSDLQEIILLLDGDAAGLAASDKYKNELGLLLSTVVIKIIELPKDTDVNELWANHLSEEMFVELLQQKPPQNEELLSQKEEKLTQKVIESPKELQAHELNASDPHNLIYKGSYAMFYVKGFGGLKHLDSLKITLVTEDERSKKYRGKVELYEDKEVRKYCREASEKLGVSEDLLDLDISLLTDKLEEYRASQESEENAANNASTAFKISPKSIEKAIDFLKKKNLLFRLNELIGKTGIVGEEKTRLLLLIVASSYKCKDPLHALIQGSTGMGKTLLLRKIMDMIPEQSRHVWTRISDKSLYHAKDKFKHSSIAIEDWDGLSEEVQYVVREMQSGKQLTSTITQKLMNGKMDNIEILAEGPIATLMCTTHGAIYEDNMSRCLLVAIDESEEQTERILEYQYRKDRGEIDNEEEEKATQLIQNLVYLLEDKSVVNPFAGKVKLPPKVHKIRRLNHLFQCFVKQITWWHQLQRKTDKKGRLITEKEDVQLAIDLLFETIILKVDELDGSLRQFFESLKGFVLEKEEGEKHLFGRREMRQALKLSKSQQHRFLQQLLDLEYIKQVGGAINRGYQYQIIYWDDNKALRKEIQAYMSNQLNLL